jgi:hypothetical protein
MIYIILSNVGMAVMMVILYFRYSHFRLSSTAEIKKLRAKCDEQSSALRVADQKLVEETKADLQKIQSLMTEVGELRKDKENEIKLRLTAEKQIELTLEKMQNLEKRMEDWKTVQDSVMRDSKDAIIKVGNDLFKKLNDSYKHEVETTRNLIGRITKATEDSAKNNPKPATKTVEKNIKTEVVDFNLSEVEDTSKALISDFVETMKASGHLVNKDYFLPANFDEQKAKLLLCEIAFVTKETLYLLDFKGCNYLAEFNHIKTKNLTAAQNHLRQKFDRYFAYLADVKYRGSIDKVMATTKAKFSKVVSVIALPSSQDLQDLKEINYYEKAQRIGFQIMDSNGINNIIL